MEKIISLSGLHCDTCVKSIEKQLSSLKGIEKVRVSLIENRAFVTFDPKLINLDRIKSEIRELGYFTEEVSKENRRGFVQGIAYGILPHIGCIAFILGSVFGVTVFMQFFKPLLFNPYFFYILILISLGFATASSALYLKNNGLLSMDGAKRKWKYITTMYGSTIIINLVFFMLIFPLLANVSLASPTTGGLVASSNGASSIVLEVDIPCSGHAPLISEELKTIDGVEEIKFSFPNLFDVRYDPAKTSKAKILSLEVFNTYKATVKEESAPEQNSVQYNSQTNAGSCCGSGSCDGSCGYT